MLNTIRDMLGREPFKPFRIVLTSGDRLDVQNRQLAVVMPCLVFIAQPRSDAFTLLGQNQIAAVESTASVA